MVNGCESDELNGCEVDKAHTGVILSCSDNDEALKTVDASIHRLDNMQCNECGNGKNGDVHDCGCKNHGSA